MLGSCLPMAKCLHELLSIISVFVQLNTWVGIRGSQFSFSRPPGCLANIGAFTSTGSLSKQDIKPKPFSLSAEKDLGRVSVNIQAFFYIINEHIWFGRKLCMPVMESCYTVYAVVKQIFPPTIQQIYRNKCNRASGGGGWGGCTQEKCQQPAEMDSSVSINVPVLPNCSVTPMQGHSRMLSPPLMATSQGSPVDNRDANTRSASLCGTEQNYAWRGELIFGFTGHPHQPQLQHHRHLAQHHCRLVWAECVCQTDATWWVIAWGSASPSLYVDPSLCCCQWGHASQPHTLCQHQCLGSPMQKHIPLAVLCPTGGGPRGRMKAGWLQRICVWSWNWLC